MTYRRRRKSSKIIKILLLILIVGVIYVGYQYSKYQYLIDTPVDETDSTNISFIVEKGETINQITKKLYEKDLILEEGAFKIYTRIGGYDRNIIAGRAILHRSQTIPEIVESLTNSVKDEITLTIPEGSTVEDIDDTLVRLGVINAGEFNVAVKEFDDYNGYSFLQKDKIKDLIYPLEGYLFPDTYFIDPQKFNVEDQIQVMLNTFENRLKDEINKENEHNFHDIIIMASIVEKEVRTKEDIPIVAGILWKRLDTGWLLGADATLLYLKSDRNIEYSDLQEDSPYNTRKNGGLPPGPISNPGLKHIMGTIYPEESPYFFYLTTLDTGEVIYGRTNEEHNQNKQKYLY